MFRLRQGRVVYEWCELPIGVRRRYDIAIIALMYMSGINLREIDVTVLIDISASMYNPTMSDAPDVPEDVAIFKARNQLAEIIEKARYYNGVTFLMNRGKRVAAVVPVEVGERYLAERAKGDES